MSNIELNVVALGNFKGLESQLASLQAQINSMNASLASGNASLTAKQMTGLSNAFHQSMMASGQFTSKLVSMSTAAQHLGERLQKSKTNMTDYRNAMKKISDQSNIYNQLAQRQVGMQQAIVQSMGNGMARVYAQHNVDLSEASIRSKVFTQAIVAQNTALMQGATKIINWGKNMQWAGRQLTAGLTMPVTLFAGALAKMYNEVDANLTRLSRVYGVGLEKPTQAMLTSVRKDVIGLAKELGHELGISAAEVSDTAAQFAAAGLTGEQLISATKQASRLVVLGETDKQEAIKATIALQTAYKLNTEETTNAVNFFNAAQAATSTSMTDLVEAIPRVGPIIEGLGGSYKDMVAILTALKEGGVPAGEAANAIKNSLGRIINPTKAAQSALKGFGIDINAIVNKNAGNLIGTLTDLQSGLDKLSSLDRQRAISELFGKFQFARMAAFMDNFNKTGSQSAKVVEMMGMSAADLAQIADDQTKQIQQSASGRFKIAIEDLKNSLLPMGESALNMFTKLIEKVQGFFETINNLPGPIKSFLKIMGGLSIITGPIIMLVGLFGNLLGQVSKGLVNLRTFGMALANIRNGVNPLTILGKKFQLTTEEMIAETNAAKIFGNTMESNVSPINAVTTAIEQLIAAMKELNVTSLTAATQKVQTQAGAMGSAASAVAFRGVTGKGNKVGGQFTETLKSHYYPFEFMAPSGKSAEDYGKTPILGSGRENQIRGLTTVGTRTQEGTIGYALNKAIGSQQTIILKGYEEQALALRAQLASQLEGKFTQDQINMALDAQFITEQQIVELEAANKAQRIIISDKTSEIGKAIALRSAQARDELAIAGKTLQGAALIERETQISYQLQSDINEMLANDTKYLQIKDSLMNEFNAQLSEATSLEEKENAIRLMMTRYMTEELDEVVNFTKNLKLGAGEAGRLQQILRYASEAALGIPGAIAALESALVQETIEVKQIVPSGSGTVTSGGRFKNAMTGGGLAMGVGMGASMAGGFMMGSENKNVANAGSALMYGGMAASMAPLFGMSGPVGLALGAVVGLGVALKKVQDESTRLKNGMNETFRISDVAAKQFGVTIRDLADVQITHLIGKSTEAKDAVSQMAEAYRNAEGSTKNYIDAISKLDDAETITKKMIEKFYTDLASGLSPEQARQDIAAVLQAAGKEDYAITVKLRLENEGIPSSPGMALRKSIENLTGNTNFAELSKMKAERKALEDQVNNQSSPTNDFQLTKLNQLDMQIKTMSDRILEDSASIGTAIDNAFNTMSVRDFGEALKELGPDFTENEGVIKTFIDKLSETNPEFAKILNNIHAQGASWSNTLRAAQLYADGTIQTIEEVRNAAKDPVLLDFYIVKHESETLIKSATSRLAAAKQSATSGSSSGGGGGSGSSDSANKALDKQIEKNKELIDLIKKQMDERKKAIDLAQKELDFSKTKMSLENQIRDALASGNFLKAAELQNELAVTEAKKLQEDQQNAADKADQDRIDALEAKNKELEKKKKTGSSGGGGASSSAEDAKAAINIEEKLKKAIEDHRLASLKSMGTDMMRYSQFGEWAKSLNAQKYKKWFIDQGYTEQEATKFLQEFWDTSVSMPSSEFAAKSEVMKTKIQDLRDKLSKGLISPETFREELRSLQATGQAQVDKWKLSASVATTVDVIKYPHIRTSSGAIDSDSEKEMRRVSSAKIQFYRRGGLAKYTSNGGAVSGPGGPTDDLVPAMLSSGEYVIKASAVSKYGAAVMQSINDGTFNISGISTPTFNMPGAATSVSPNSSTNNVIINADIAVHGGDARETAQEVMKQLDMINRKAGGRIRF